MKIFLWVGLPVIAAMGIPLGAVDLVPAWQAKGGGGVAGTFTAEREECGRRFCSFYGTWTAAHGSATRDDVILYDEPRSLRVGGTTEALDSGAGNGVFATSGGPTYLLVTGSRWWAWPLRWDGSSWWCGASGGAAPGRNGDRTASSFPSAERGWDTADRRSGQARYIRDLHLHVGSPRRHRLSGERRRCTVVPAETPEGHRHGLVHHHDRAQR